jgi:type II secretory pathway pseudopilin PulG
MCQPWSIPDNRTGPQRRRRESGAMLLAVLFLLALMVITAMAVAPSFVLQAKRDREEEMIHRGTEYARAIRKYYKRFGQYPSSLEQLNNTNQIRFLRKRFKDPLTVDGGWKLVHYGDIASLLGANGNLNALSGLQGANQAGGLNSNSTGLLNSGANAGNNLGANTAPAGAQLSPQQSVFTPNVPQGATQTDAGSQSTGDTSGVTTTPGSGPGQGGQNPVGAAGQNPEGVTGQNPTQTGNNNTIFGNTGVGGQTFGGGAIVGVASKSKDPTIRIFNKKKTYDEWIFIYSPMMDIANTLLRGPYNGQTFTPSQIGTPAGQLNQQQPGNVGSPGFGPQNPQQNQQIPAGGQFPPDQTQQPQ